ncbi:serine O-acetyltransferase [Psittacicella gerlachiana]|uniref:Serine acetyltransferase n=1 Tax=Psittacicella gerlachiana TaxID=2028574 RepID=A0A3A1YDI3_9GAMM|nr:serine O-acetyltransferase [Psittacicella gerlachiana]RIY35601.1 serine O-acetyltransferase [Psittacicella gerlachiana]
MTDLVDKVWQQVREQARHLVEHEPMLASFYHATILKHESLAHALSYILAKKLALNSILDAIALREIIQEAFEAQPEIIQQVAQDMLAVVERDPAVDKLTTPLLYLKGFHALQAYRITHYLWQGERKDLAIFLQNEISLSLGVDIHPAAKIGAGIMLDHATGIVIGETTCIDDNVSILQGVTLGGTGKESGDRHPKIGKGVMIGAGAKILGNIHIGENAKIGANSVVLKSVPAGCTAAGVPAKVISQSTSSCPAREMDQNFISIWDALNI